jgi:uncharacterized delta-60 repeat protein
MKRYYIALMLVGWYGMTCLSAQQFDLNFQPFITRPGDVQEIRTLPDGRFVIAGEFTLANRIAESNIARFFADGTLDQSFQATLAFNVSAMDVQADGKVIIGGFYTGPDAAEELNVLRLLADGSIDPSFQVSSIPSGQINDIAVEPSGSVLVGGSFLEVDGQPAQGLVRLGAQGGFVQAIAIAGQGNVLVSELLSQPNGRFAVGGTRGSEGFVSYHMPSGQEVPGFQFSSNMPEPNNFMTSVRDLAFDQQGRIVLTASTFLIRYAVVGLNFDGSLNYTNSFIGVPLDLAINAAGDILVCGEFENINAVHRYIPGQGLDIYSQGNGADGLLRKLSPQADGTVLTAGNFSTFNGQAALSIVKLQLNGQLSPAFSAAVERPGIVRSVIRYDANRVCIGGDFARVGERELINVARIMLNDGSTDPNFLNAGLYYRNRVNHITLDAQGRLLLAATNNNDGQSIKESPILRLLPNGLIDGSFTPTVLPVGVINQVRPIGNGQTLAMGNFAIFNNGLVAIDVAVYEEDGSVDEAFSDRFSGKVTTCLPRPNGGYWIAGNNIRFDGSAPSTIIRLTANFELDPGFQAPADLGCTGNCRFVLAEQADGRLLVGGPIFMGTDSSLVRLQANGNPDASFQLDAPLYRGDSWVNGRPDDMQLLDNGDILVVGGFTQMDDTPLRGMLRLSADGTIADELTQNTFDRQRVYHALKLEGEQVLLSGNLANQSGSLPQAMAIADLTTTPTLNPSISGTITSWQGEPMAQIEVTLGGAATRSTVTDSLGRYRFESLLAGSTYTVQAVYDIGTANGLSTFDLMLINKHILGIEPFNEPYELLAADVNNSGSITISDMIGIRRIILGISDSFPDHTSWCFFLAGHSFSNPTNPWLTLPPTSASINLLPEGVEGIDFNGVKIGDVNGSAQVP